MRSLKNANSGRLKLNTKYIIPGTTKQTITFKTKLSVKDAT